MTTLWATYPSHRLAERAVDVLRKAGIPATDISIIHAADDRDRRELDRGAFAGRVAPDDPVATFGDRARPRSAAEGTFAGDGDEHRKGTFADTPREVVVQHPSDSPTERVIDDGSLSEMLASVGIHHHHAQRLLEELHDGRHVVLAQATDDVAGTARARLEAAIP
jgi:hypothetical protein